MVLLQWGRLAGNRSCLLSAAFRVTAAGLGVTGGQAGDLGRTGLGDAGPAPVRTGLCAHT